MIKEFSLSKKEEGGGLKGTKLFWTPVASIICIIILALAALPETVFAQRTKTTEIDEWESVISDVEIPQSRVTTYGPTWGNEPPAHYNKTPVFDIVNIQTGDSIAGYYDEDKTWLWSGDWKRYLKVTTGCFLEYEKSNPENPVFRYERDKDGDGYLIEIVLEDRRPKWPVTRINLSNNEKSKWYLVWR